MKKNVNFNFFILALWVLSLFTGGCLKLRYPAEPPPPEYMDMRDTYDYVEVEPIKEPVATFMLDGKPYCFAGTNNYYLNFKSDVMIDDVLDKAVEMNLGVIRFWGYLDRGSLDGSVAAVDPWPPGDGTKEGFYLQYWDPETQTAKYNDGPFGFEKIDYLIHGARERGLKLVYVLTNNWHEFGGMDQYLTWYGLTDHYQFFTDERVKDTFKKWIYHVLHRVNSIDGVVYKDDPAIFAWELGNELRCMNGSDFDNHEGWDTTTMVRWTEEMSAYIKSLDSNHMVAFGDEGFINGDFSHWAYSAQDGVDHEALCAVKDIDYCTFHLYPDNWGTGLRFTHRWIEEHMEIAHRLGKPTVLEEYGTMVKRDKEDMKEIKWGWERRRMAYENWLGMFRNLGGHGAMNWMLAGYDDYLKALYPDYDGYTVYKDFPTGDLIVKHANEMSDNAPACIMAESYLPDDVEKSPFVSVYSPRNLPAPAAETTNSTDSNSENATEASNKTEPSVDAGVAKKEQSDAE
ncbi:MAG: cellulase family glycosylhydrolase [Deltaproteobacteria bacterium]|nr:cellulase family glycosylhydrolase [Deltaproteobacteria bacterium]MBN2673767.1 cellulase family glycosylhydrolase [Deltaproteobacteria bacterium]